MQTATPMALLTAPMADLGTIGTVKVILIALGVAVLYGLIVLGRPHVTCYRCHGKKVIRRTRNGHKSKRKCWVCKAKGTARLPGATMVHRFFWLVAGDHIQQKRRDDNAERLASRPDRSAQ